MFPATLTSLSCAGETIQITKHATGYVTRKNGSCVRIPSPERCGNPEDLAFKGGPKISAIDGIGMRLEQKKFSLAKRPAALPNRSAAKIVLLRSRFHIRSVDRNHRPIPANFVADDDTRHALQQGHTCRQKPAFDEEFLGGQLDDKRGCGNK